MPVFGGGGGRVSASLSPSGVGGVGVGVSQLSDVPPLVQPTAPTDVDRAFSLFDQLNSFFDRPETQQVTDRITDEVQQRLPEPEIIRDTFIDRIRNFFSGLFG